MADTFDDLEEGQNDAGTDTQDDDAGDTSDSDSSSDEMVPKRELDKLYARTKKAEAEVKKLKAKGDAKTPSTMTRDEVEEIVDLRQSGYSKQELDLARVFAQGQKISLADALQNEFVQGGIEKLRSKNQSSEATPAPSGRVYTTPEGQKKSWADMNGEERRHAFNTRQMVKVQRRAE